MKSTSRTHAVDAWTHYWSRAAAASPGCLPDLPAAVAGRLQSIRATFFDHLPLGARLLDLGTGSGAVLLHAHDCRPDLRLSGVDYASALPDLGDSITLHPGTRLEELPFGEGSFDAVTSQFAIEYGQIAAAVKEVGRVLTGGGGCLFICHHAEGVVVRDNRARFGALRELLSHAGLLATAVKAVRQRKKAAPETRQRLARIFDAARRKHPDQTVVHEVACDIARIMVEPNSLEKLLSLRRDLEREGQRIEALQHAALTESRARGMAAMLSVERQRVGLDVIHVPGTGDPFAWLIASTA